MLSNPYETIPYKESSWAEGFCKGLAAIASPAPSEAIAEEDYDAFNEGIATGSDICLNGISFDQPCVAALEGSPAHYPVLAIDGADILHAAWEARHLAGLAGAFASLIEVIVSVGCSANHELPPEQVLPSLGNEITQKIHGYGATSLEFFCGVSLNPLSADCTMQMSPLFLTLEQARAAAISVGAPEGWLVVSWRTDQSNSFRIVTSSD